MFSSRANTHLGKRWRSVSEGEPKLVIQAPLSRKFDAHDALGDVITFYRIFFSYKLVLLVEWLVKKSSLMSVEDAVEDINYLDSCHHQLMSFCGKLYNCSGLKVFACSDTELGKILFHFILFCDKENRDLLSKIYFFYFGKISRFAGPLNIFVSLLVPVNKRIHRTKFEMEEENTK